ncbi:MAG: hypothetical protein GZ087_11375 [Flavobacterium sp.]|nr:hypothetical protein [Flavobacterium sp.]
MAKIFSDGKIPKRFEGYVIYPLWGEHIIKEKTGFTTEGLKDDPKYAKSRENASEFGVLTQSCKAIRMALNEGLPKSNNLEVCNGLTTIMRKVMCCDTVAERGNRCLKNGFESAGGKSLFVGYDFNPSGLFRTTFKGNYHFDISKRKLVFEPFKTQEAFVFPEGVDCVGFRLGALRFDFGTSASFLQLTDMEFYGFDSRSTKKLRLCIKDFPDGEGVIFFLLEVAFFIENEGTFVSIPQNDTKVVYVLGVE